MATTKKNTPKNIISINPVVSTQEETIPAGPNQLSLAIKPAKPTKLRINTVQGKALAKETVALIKREVEARRAELPKRIDFIEALNKHMQENELLSQLVIIKEATSSIDFRSIERQIDKRNSNRASGVSYISRVYVSGLDTALSLLKEDFYQEYFATELKELNLLSLSEETIYTRIMVSTINFVDNTTLQQFQRQTIADLAPQIVRAVPSLDPANFSNVSE